MNLLISLADFEPIRQLTSNLDVKKLNPYIQEAQNFDLRPVLGEAFFYDLLANSDDSIYQDLLNGKEYQNANDETVAFEGLAAALKYFAYARYIESSNTHSTAYGLVSKTNDFSQQAQEKTIARMVTNARSSAKGYLDDVLKFLAVNADDYPIWKQSCNSGKKATGGIKITAVDASDNCYPKDSNYDPNNPPNPNKNWW